MVSVSSDVDACGLVDPHTVYVINLLSLSSKFAHVSASWRRSLVKPSVSSTCDLLKLDLALGRDAMLDSLIENRGVLEVEHLCVSDA